MDQRFAEQWVLDFTRFIDSFGVRVLDADKVFYFESVELDIDVFIDAGAEHKASVFGIVGGQVGATAAKGNAQRCSGYYQA